MSDCMKKKGLVIGIGMGFDGPAVTFSGRHNGVQAGH